MQWNQMLPLLFPKKFLLGNITLQTLGESIDICCRYSFLKNLFLYKEINAIKKTQRKEKSNPHSPHFINMFNKLRENFSSSPAHSSATNLPCCTSQLALTAPFEPLTTPLHHYNPYHCNPPQGCYCTVESPLNHSVIDTFRSRNRPLHHKAATVQLYPHETWNVSVMYVSLTLQLSHSLINSLLSVLMGCG